MKAARLIGWGLVGVLALAVLTYVVLIAINWNDRAPNAAARRFEQIISDRPAVPAADNAVVYLLGFTAPADADPVEVGTRRMAWLEAFDASTDPRSDPLGNEVSFTDTSASAAGMRSLCGPDADRQACATTFATLAREWQPNELDSLALSRYQALLTRRGWRDVVPMDMKAPMIAYGNPINAQRLRMLQLMQLAQRGKRDEVREGLATDFAFWRAAVPAADNLLGQMIAVAAIRNHFLFANLVLHSLPPGDSASVMPQDWSREFSAAERSMLRVMAGELAFIKDALMQAQQDVMLTETAAGIDQPTWSGRWVGRVTDPFFQLQDTVNGHADELLGLCEAFEVPMSEYLAARQSWDSGSDKAGTSMYNMIGTIILSAHDRATYSQYALRAASVEGMRRAALLAAQLRARGIAAEALGGEIMNSPLRDPYTHEPFEWNVTRGSVTFNAPEKHSRSTTEYFY